MKYHINISQMLPHHICGDTCQILKWVKEPLFLQNQKISVAGKYEALVTRFDVFLLSWRDKLAVKKTSCYLIHKDKVCPIVGDDVVLCLKRRLKLFTC